MLIGLQKKNPLIIAEGDKWVSKKKLDLVLCQLQCIGFVTYDGCDDIISASHTFQ